jgi:hypothetical protein
MKRLRILIAIVFVLNLPLGAQNFCSTPYWQQMRCDAGTCHQAVNVTACSGRFNTIDNCYPGGMPVMCCGGGGTAQRLANALRHNSSGAYARRSIGSSPASEKQKAAR